MLNLHWSKIALFVLLLFMSSLASAEVPPIEHGILGKITGDVIAVKTDAEIAAWCDFNKIIVTTPNNVLCVYAGPKRSRTSGYGFSWLKSVKSTLTAINNREES